MAENFKNEAALAPVSPAVLGFLACAGQIGCLIEHQDWSAHPLKGAQDWPSTLKCALASILGSPRAMYVLWGPELMYFFNGAYAPMLGKHLDGAMGRPFAQVWPELWADFEPMLRQALKGQGCSHENTPLTLARHGYAESTWWTFSYLPLRDEQGAVVGVHCVCLETTELVRARARQAFWLELSGALRNAHTPEDLKALAATRLGRYLKASCVGYGEIDEATQYCRVRHDWTAEGFSSVVGTHRLDDFGPLMAQQLRAGRTVTVQDIAQDPRTADQAFRGAYQAIGKKAFIDAPLIKDGRLAAILFVLHAEPRAWLDSEQALVEEVAERTWLALQQLQSELDLRLTHEMLDHRTTELLHAENALRQSQKLEALGQLTSGVAHDVNNLLAVISNSAELLCSPCLAQDQRALYLKQIIETVARATRLAGQLLDFARQQPLKPEVFDVAQQSWQVLDLVRPLLGGQIVVNLQGCEAKDCLAEADISQFETALVNLAVNARDAMQAKGHIAVHVQHVDRVPGGSGRSQQLGRVINCQACSPLKAGPKRFISG